VHNNCSEKFWYGKAARSIMRGLLVALAALAVSGIASAQDKEDKKDESCSTFYRTQPLLPPLRRTSETLCFWRPTALVLRAMFVCPLAQEFPGP